MDIELGQSPKSVPLLSCKHKQHIFNRCEKSSSQLLFYELPELLCVTWGYGLTMMGGRQAGKRDVGLVTYNYSHRRAHTHTHVHTQTRTHRLILSCTHTYLKPDKPTQTHVHPQPLAHSCLCPVSKSGVSLIVKHEIKILFSIS